jgi:hypothetical protein
MQGSFMNFEICVERVFHNDSRLSKIDMFVNSHVSLFRKWLDELSGHVRAVVCILGKGYVHT